MWLPVQVESLPVVCPAASARVPARPLAIRPSVRRTVASPSGLHVGRLSVIHPVGRVSVLGTPVEGVEGGIMCGKSVEAGEGLSGVVPSAPVPEDTWASGPAIPRPLAVPCLHLPGPMGGPRECAGKNREHQ